MPAPGPSRLPSPEDVLELLRRRRTARAHGVDPLPAETLPLLLEAVRWSPSAANRQPWELIVVEADDVKRRLRELFLADAAGRGERYRAVTERQADLLLAPTVIAVCGDERTKEAFVNAPELGDAVQEELFVLTMGAAIQNLLLMATACGLTSTWIARAARAPGVRDVLGAPPWLRIVALVALGRGRDERARSGQRRPIGEKTHVDSFGVLRDAARRRAPGSASS